jgi:hypothetical protein
MNATLHFFIQNTVFASAAYFVFRLFVTKFFESGVKKYENKLNQDLEAYKSKLNQVTFEHKVRFERLHYKKEEVMIRLHEETCKCEDSLTHLTSMARGFDSPDDEERVALAFKEINELSRTVRFAKLFIEPKFSDKLEELLSLARKVFFGMQGVKRDEAEFQRKVRHYNLGLAVKVGEAEAMKPIEDWDYFRDKIQSEFRAVRENIVNDFRETVLEGNRPDK